MYKLACTPTGSEYLLLVIYFLAFVTLCLLIGLKWYLKVIIIYISIMTNHFYTFKSICNLIFFFLELSFNFIDPFFAYHRIILNIELSDSFFKVLFLIYTVF